MGIISSSPSQKHSISHYEQGSMFSPTLSEGPFVRRPISQKARLSEGPLVRKSGGLENKFGEDGPLPNNKYSYKSVTVVHITSHKITLEG